MLKFGRPFSEISKITGLKMTELEKIAKPATNKKAA